jgi:murein DD-endopeptidase MepM/ murein hydrolase activator NlpD
LADNAGVVRRPGLFAAAVVALTVVSAGASVSRKEVQPSAQASAFAIRVITPGVPGGSAGVVTAPPDAAAAKGPFAYPADGSAVSAAAVSASALATPTGPTRSDAISDVSGLSLFGGEITAEAIEAHSLATALPKKVRSDFGGSRVVRLQALGQAVPGVPGTSVNLADWGTLSVLEQTSTRSATRGLPGYRGALTALHVHLLLDHGGLPAGSDIFVGSAEAIVQAGTPPVAVRKPAPPREPTSTPEPKEPPARKRAPGLSLEPPPRAAPPTVHPPLTAGGYVFPVYGPTSWTDTFGAPRADVTYHHGDDIFAPLGAPILAIADGTLFSVGWNDIGGLRVWLRDGAGNEFYYAHLSALSTTAFNGAVVHAGDVIGFVGNTGDARGTPYHLHFEIHPVSRLYLGYDGAVDPSRYLSAWETLTDVAITGVVGWAPPLGSGAPKAGAILLQASDISTASGLDPASLRRAFRAGAALVPGRTARAPRVVAPAQPLDRG